jgi:LmbE family N-acetylglucosaminyl deacetylase
VTATLGEHGTDDPRGWPPRRLRKVREREPTASLAALGVTEHFLVGLTDGSCARADRAAVVAQWWESSTPSHRTRSSPSAPTG